MQKQTDTLHPTLSTTMCRQWLRWAAVCWLAGVCFTATAQAPLLMRDVFASAPDSIFPLMTKNNRLDCIDFIENGMQANVKNRLDERTELQALTKDYLLLQLSERSTVEIRLVGDSVLYLVRTCKGPTEDSHICCFDTRWKALPCPIERPCIDDFLTEGVDEDVRSLLRALPLMKATLHAETNQLTWTLQTSELPKSLKEKAEGMVHPITVDLPTRP